MGRLRLSDTEAAVLGDAVSDIVTIEVYDPATNKILSSDQLKESYEFIQDFSTDSPTDKIGLVVISNFGTADEVRTLLPNSELIITQSSNLHLSGTNKVTISIRLRLTNAIVWLAPYTEDALKHLTVGKANSVTSTGGSTPQTITTSPVSSITDAAGSGAAYTLRQMESESAAAAAKAHRTGYISIEGFHRRLTSGR